MKELYKIDTSFSERKDQQNRKKTNLSNNKPNKKELSVKLNNNDNDSRLKRSNEPKTKH